MTGQSKCPIAITGIACWFPGSRNKNEVFTGLVGREPQFREFPRKRLDPRYVDTSNAPDKTYCPSGAFIDGIDKLQARMSRAAQRESDIAHQLALQVAIEAVEDAFGPDYDTSVDKIRAQVVVGNTLNGEISRAHFLRSRWPYVDKCIRQVMGDRLCEETLKALEVEYKKQFPPITKEYLPGSLPSVIPGRIACELDWKAGAFTVDTACGSSLMAVKLGCDNIESGRCTVALVGGVDVSQDILELCGFSKVGALSTSGHMRVFDARHDGFISGEGCAFLVLEPLHLAQQRGARVYAIICGTGMSSDGAGPVTSPSVDGQVHAWTDCYSRCDYGPDKVDWISAHGTGTQEGDRVELQAASRARCSVVKPRDRSCQIHSGKVLVGHTKAAAGVRAMIEAILVVCMRIKFPSAACEQPHMLLKKVCRDLYIGVYGEVLPPDIHLRADIEAAGFGRHNVHIALCSPDAPATAMDVHLTTKLQVEELMAGHQSHEVLLFLASSDSDLAAHITATSARARGCSFADLKLLAAETCRAVEAFQGERLWRCSLVVDAPLDIHAKADIALLLLRDLAIQVNALAAPPTFLHKTSACRHVVVSTGCSPQRVGLLFPGQGSQQLAAGYNLRRRYRKIADPLLHDFDREFKGVGLSAISDSLYPAHIDQAIAGGPGTDAHRERLNAVAGGAIPFVSLLQVHVLRQAGVRVAQVLGHSLGHVTALVATGHIPADVACKVLAARAKALSDHALGGMVVVFAGFDIVNGILSRGPIDAYVSNLNGQSQTVVSGTARALQEVIERCETAGVRSIPLRNVQGPFHSPLMEGPATNFATDLGTILTGRQLPPSSQPRDSDSDSDLPSTAVVSCLDPTLHFDSDLVAELRAHVTGQVNFLGAISSHDCDMLIDVGPGRVLRDLAAPATAVPVCSMDSDENSAVTVAALHAFDSLEVPTALHFRRLSDEREYTPATELSFIANPCEGAVSYPDADNSDVTSSTDGPTKQPSSLRFILQALQREHLRRPPSRSWLPKSLQALGVDCFGTAQIINALCALYGVQPTDSDVETRWKNEPLERLADHLDDILVQAGHVPLLRTDCETILDMATDTAAATSKSSGNADEVEMGVVLPDPYCRTVVMGAVAQPLPNDNMTSSTTTPVLPLAMAIFCMEGSKSLALALQLRIDRHVASCFVVTQASLASSGAGGLSFLAPQVAAIILPRDIDPLEDPSAIHNLMALLHYVCSLPSAHVTVAVQFGHPTSHLPRLPVLGSSQVASAFVNTLFAEKQFVQRLQSKGHGQPRHAVHSLTFLPSTTDDVVAQCTTDEILAHHLSAAPAKLQTNALFSTDATRHVPQFRVLHPFEYRPYSSPLNLSPRDVVIVTGGAKGITAKLALHLARSSGARLVLVGSSPEADLRIFTEAGVEAHYHQCNIGHVDAVELLVDNVLRDLGRIDAVLHGATRNEACSISQTTVAAGLAEVAPKLLGAISLLRSLRRVNVQLKALVALTSVAGVGGQLGNGWYAFSNQALAGLVRDYGSRHSNTIAKCLGPTVVSDVGMAARMGSIPGFSHIGVEPITPDQLVSSFDRWVQGDAGCVQEHAVSRGERDHPAYGVVRPLLRLPYVVEEVRRLPGVEYISIAHVTRDDPLVAHHVFDGVPLLPAIMGLEMMAQASLAAIDRALLPRDARMTIENIKLLRKMEVRASTGPLRLLVHAVERERLSGTDAVCVDAVLRPAHCHDAHFSATFVFRPAGVMASAPAADITAVQWTSLDVRHDFYMAGLTFQTGSYQRVTRFGYAGRDNIPAFEVTWPTHDAILTGGVEPATIGEDRSAGHDSAVLGDPYTRDSLLHAVSLLLLPVVGLPVKISELVRHLPAQETCGTAVVLMHPTSASAHRLLADPDGPAPRSGSESESEFTFDVVARDAVSGELLEELRGYTLHTVLVQSALPTLPHLLSNAGATADLLSHLRPVYNLVFGTKTVPLMQKTRRKRSCVEVPLSAVVGLASNWEMLPKDLRHQMQRSMLSKLGRKASELSWTAEGRPTLQPSSSVAGNEPSEHVSITHSQRHCVMLVSATPVGVDLLDIERALGMPVPVVRQDALLKACEETWGSHAMALSWCVAQAAAKAMNVSMTPAFKDLHVLPSLGPDGTLPPVAVELTVGGNAVTTLALPVILGGVQYVFAVAGPHV